MPTQYCYGGYPGFAAGGIPWAGSGGPGVLGGWQTWDEFNAAFYTLYSTEAGFFQSFIDPNGFALLGLLQGGPATLPLSGMGAVLAALTPQIEPADQNGCTQNILNAVNSQFGTNFTPDDVTRTFTPRGGATNLVISGTGLPAGQFNSLQPGRYASSPLTWLTGYGPTLHITGENYFNAFPATFQNGNIGGATSVLFTAHIDYGFLFNPIGALYHLFREVLHIGGPRKPC
jgi:hypothetical protein